MGAVMVPAEAGRRIASVLSAIEGVEGVYVRFTGEFQQVFTVVAQEDDDTLDAIYDHERHLIREFSDRTFDFNVVVRRGKKITEILGDVSAVWQRHDWCPTAEAI